MMTVIVRRMVVLWVLSMPFALMAATPASQVDAIIARPAPPPGVVFEIAGKDAAALRWAVPQIRTYVQRLRARFPALDIAVVTHGEEQFALESAAENRFGEVHEGVRELVQEGVPVHVCETNAAHHGVASEAFPDYVNVSAAGPAQIKDYQNLGYALIRLRHPG